MNDVQSDGSSEGIFSTLKRPLALAFLLAATGLISTRQAAAADHVDSPGDVPDLAADITDLYAFATPQGKIAFVLNVFMNAGPGARFSDAVTYQVKFTPLTPTGEPEDRLKAYKVACTFAVDQKFGCTLESPAGEVLAEHRSTVGTEPAESKFRVYAGRRRDPFFIDPTLVGKARDPAAADSFTGKNSTEFVDVLSIVMEFDRNLIPDQRKYFGVYSEILNKRGSEVLVVDRMGRIEITNLTIGVSAIAAEWNREQTLALSEARKPLYVKALTQGIRRLDQLDGTADWTDQAIQPLLNRYLDDYLWTDFNQSGINTTNGYMSLELQDLRGEPLTAPGGRWLNDDTMDVYLTLHIGGARGKHREDGVGHSADPATTQFPYLKKPYLQ